jgi:O-antigen/teichoic acid export membrane protein
MQAFKSSVRGAATMQWPASRRARKPPAESADARVADAEKKGAWSSVLHIMRGAHVVALSDQAVVSGTSFLTTVLVGRWVQPSGLGAYSIAISLLLSLWCVQESLISFPYTVQRHRASGMPAEYAGSSLANNGLVSGLAAVALAMCAVVLSAGNAARELVAALWVLAGLVPFVLLREFARRFAFAHMRMGQALRLDLAVAAMQVSGLCALGWSGRMSAATACAVVGAACGVAAIVWLQLPHANFVVRGVHVWQTMKQSWALGKWLLAGQFTLWVRAYVAYWLLAWIAGTAATGVYAASMSIVSFANPLILGFSNLLAPKAALALSEGGGARLLRETIRDALLIGAVMSVFCLAILLTGENVMRLLYPGKEYEGQGNTLTVLSFALLAFAMAMPPTNALASLERPRGIFWNALVALLLTVIFVVYLVEEWGLIGAAYGLLVGNVANSTGRWIAFLRFVKHAPTPRPAGRPSDAASANIVQVLEELTQNANASNWTIETLGEGFEAYVYAVRSQSQQLIWQTHRALVIKLFKPTTPNFEWVREQFESLCRLHQALDGRSINGWKIFVPAPLYLCKSPLALVMTAVPGSKLESCLQTGNNIPSDVLESAPRAIAAAMKGYWSFGRPYGELNLSNILCDIASKVISFIDSGVRENSPLFIDMSTRWSPAARDIAYLLFEAGTTMTIGHHAARKRKQIFIDRMLQAFIGMDESFEEKRLLLKEIEACAEARLKTLTPSWSPRGLWQLLVKRIAAHHIDASLRRLEAALVERHS